MNPAEAEDALRAASRKVAFHSPDASAEMVEALMALRDHYTDRAIDGAIDNGLSIGFVRGIRKILKLVEEGRIKL